MRMRQKVIPAMILCFLLASAGCAPVPKSIPRSSEIDSSSASSSSSSSAVSSSPSSSAASSSSAANSSSSSSAASSSSSKAASSAAGASVIQVHNITEFIAAVKSNVTIKLMPGDYNMDLAKGSKNPQVCFGTSDFDGGATLINVKNLTVYSDDKAKVLLYSKNPNNNVLLLKNGSNISFKNVTMGHKLAEGACNASVVFLRNCTSASFAQCDIFGCGTSGFYIMESSKINVTDSVIHNCIYNVATIADSKTISFSNSVLRNIGNDCNYSGLFEANDSTGITITKCDIHDNGYNDTDSSNWAEDMFYSNITNAYTLTGCKYSNNNYQNLPK